MEYRTDLALEYTSQRASALRNGKTAPSRASGKTERTTSRWKSRPFPTTSTAGTSCCTSCGMSLAPCSRNGAGARGGPREPGDHPGRPGPTDRRAGIGNTAHPRGNRTHHRIGRPAPGGGGQHRRVGMHRRRNQGTPDRIGAGIPALRGDRGGRPRRAQPGALGVHHPAEHRGFPRSGVNNARPQLSRETLGVPVIGIGVPTVVDAGTLAADLLGRAAPKDKVSPRGAAWSSPRGKSTCSSPAPPAWSPWRSTPRSTPPFP